MPKVSKADKEAIFGYPSEAPTSSQSSGVPMFWGESKVPAFFEALISNFAIKEIQDLTPGSGALAIAALRQGIPYQGFVWHAKHKCWLENLLDLETARLTCSKESGLHQQSLAEALSSWFHDDLAEK